jgi:L-asparaginase II
MAVAALLEVRRGRLVESRHLGALAVVDADGRLVASVGDPELPVFPRSTLKPLQALPLVESGALDRLALDLPHLALACASHGGAPDQVARVAQLLAAGGLSPDALACGVQMPYDPGAARTLVRIGAHPSPLHHPCSGKHAGFLLAAQALSAPAAGYLDPEHPVQRAVRAAVSETAGLPASALVPTLDVCHAPSWALRLSGLALAYARLLRPPDLPRARASALGRVARAMAEHPSLVGGPEGRLDTALMRSVHGLVAKSGAEGVLALAVRLPGGRPVGLALKIADGDAARRARGPVVVEALRQLGLPEAEPGGPLDPLHAGRFGPRAEMEAAGIYAGEVVAVFTLTRAGRA